LLKNDANTLVRTPSGDFFTGTGIMNVKSMLIFQFSSGCQFRSLFMKADFLMVVPFERNRALYPTRLTVVLVIRFPV